MKFFMLLKMKERFKMESIKVSDRKKLKDALFVATFQLKKN